VVGLLVGTLADSALYWFMGVHIGIAVGSIVGDLAVISVGNMVGALVGIGWFVYLPGGFTMASHSDDVSFTAAASQRRLHDGGFTTAVASRRAAAS
jgi:hypothetical protein